MSTVGERIRDLRFSFEPKLSKRAFGEKLGVSLDVINNLERDRVNVSDSILLLISKTYGVRYEWLKTGEKPMYPPETDDLLVKVTKVMEGQSEAKRQLVELICDLPDELLDQLVEFYKWKINQKKK